MGYATGTLKLSALASTAVHTHTAYTTGVRPSGFEVFSIRECGITSNALFCVRKVWQDLIRVLDLTDVPI